MESGDESMRVGMKVSGRVWAVGVKGCRVSLAPLRCVDATVALSAVSAESETHGRSIRHRHRSVIEGVGVGVGRVG